jgi:uncharacterized protein
MCSQIHIHCPGTGREQIRCCDIWSEGVSVERGIECSRDVSKTKVIAVTFLADCMLGKLARWLRILGYDTVYDNFAEDDDLLRIAETDGRILLTRDRPLVDRATERESISCIYIDDLRLEDQIAQLVVDVSLNLTRPTFTRCLECNVSILQVSPEAVKQVVPPRVFQTQTTFYKCRSCERVYWSGSHTDRMNARLADIREAIQRRREVVDA